MPYTLSIGQKAPDFKLKATDHKEFSLSSFSKAKLLVIFFTCNHCPYVLGSNENTEELANKYSSSGVEFVAINSNSANTYIEDSFENMVKVMDENNYPWTYLHDQTQQVATQYGALKTPHFYLFNQNRELIYTGRAIDNPKDHTKAMTHELEDAILHTLNGEEIEHKMTNPLGCNIKWDGKPKHWMPDAACDII